MRRLSSIALLLLLSAYAYRVFVSDVDGREGAIAGVEKCRLDASKGLPHEDCDKKAARYIEKYGQP